MHRQSYTGIEDGRARRRTDIAHEQDENDLGNEEPFHESLSQKKHKNFVFAIIYYDRYSYLRGFCIGCGSSGWYLNRVATMFSPYGHADMSAYMCGRQNSEKLITSLLHRTCSFSSTHTMPRRAPVRLSTPTPEEMAAVEKINQQMACTAQKKAGDDNKNASVASHGRNLARIVGPVPSIADAVEFAVGLDLKDNLDDDPDWTPKLTSAIQQRDWETWRIICKAMPTFREDMIQLGSQVSVRKQYCNKLAIAAKKCKGDDARSLKVHIIDYINGPGKPKPIMETQGDKSDRGFYNPDIAPLLCPAKYEPSPSVIQRIRDNTLRVKEGDIPHFMYGPDTIYDPDDPEKGLLEGPPPVLAATAKHIYQAPSVALKAPGAHRGRAGNAAINNVTALTPRDVAYVAMQARFCIAFTAHKSDSFDLVKFYWNVMKLLDCDEGAKAIELFNHQVFGHRAEKDVFDDEDTDLDDFSSIEARRAAKRRRLMEDTASQSSES
ncbi:unnamed protein product [Mycena citricolor]|uniref:Uncharacterized protein n=1 Tax=Mycena citricolor TaxID=2018698 RepID=A0AAD2JWX6_9AGAR|nr:unnamed protein product [Mycena citricolor]CAK5269510.1 unnamed protein product [Mycena citricolor]